MKLKLFDRDLDNIQTKVSDIIKSGKGDAEKQQQLFNLASQIGIPIDSSDCFCRRLHYPELFNQINNWIRSQREERYSKRSVYAAWISASTAFLAVLTSIYIHWQTRQLIIPTEKPIISIIDTNCKGKLNKDTDIEQLEITLNMILRNLGKHPTENMRIRIWGTPFEDPNSMEMPRDFTMADPLFPDTQVTLAQQINVKLYRRGDKLTAQKDKVFFCIRMDYIDGFNADKKYTQNFYLVYEIGKSSMSGSTVQEKQIFESALKKINEL